MINHNLDKTILPRNALGNIDTINSLFLQKLDKYDKKRHSISGPIRVKPNLDSTQVGLLLQLYRYSYAY